MKKSIAVIDCAVKDPAIACFNRLQRESNELLSYHNFPMQGANSLELEEGFSKIIILGSHSNVGDGSGWHAPLSRLVLEELNKGTPILGICFGHQLMAHTFGSTIENNLGSKNLEGLRAIDLKKNIFHLNKMNLSLFCSHHYQIKILSDELEVIGHCEDSPFEIVAHRSLPYWGVQSHPEGSEFFLKNEISFELSSKDKQIGFSDGIGFIKAFITDH